MAVTAPDEYEDQRPDDAPVADVDAPRSDAGGR